MPPISTPGELGLAMRERRRELGWSQRALADRLGVSRQWVVEVEGGKPRAEVGLVLRALAALDLTVSVAPRPPDLVDLGALIDVARGKGPSR